MVSFNGRRVAVTNPWTDGLSAGESGASLLHATYAGFSVNKSYSYSEGATVRVSRSENATVKGVRGVRVDLPHRASL